MGRQQAGILVVVAALGWGLAGTAAVLSRGQAAEVRSLEADAIGRETEMLNLRAAVAELTLKRCPAP